MSERDDEVASVRIPPHSVEAEQSVVGGLLLDNGAWDRIGDLLNASDFYRYEHRLIYEAIAVLVNATKPADVITVFEQLQQRGKAEDCGGLVYLNALAQSVPSAANIRRYAEIVTERALERAMITTADEIAAMAYTGAGSAPEKLDRAATLMRQLESRQARASSIRSLAELVVASIDRLNELHENPGQADAWATPFPTLNRLLAGGARPGGLYVIGARPSVGKTAIAQALCNAFAGAGLPVLFLSQEMRSEELALRMLAQASDVDLTRLLSAKLEDADWGSISKGAEAINLPVHLDDQPALTLGQIRAKARQVRGLRVLVVDYLQLTASTPISRGQSNRNNEIEETSRGLKSLAKEQSIAVILLSQLNRDVEKRLVKRPTLADLRDSGAIEQDADVVMLLWELQELPAERCKLIGVDVAKNRSGPKGEFAACFWPATMRWAESAFPVSHYTPKRVSGGDL